MCYFHIGDILDAKSKLMSRSEYERYFKESGSIKNRYIRYFKSNIGRTKALSHIKDILSEFDFVSIEEYIKSNKVSQTVKI